ncbi:MAG: ParB/RepB/Spo0J family partition protein [Ignisphaera sp.]
MEIIYKDPKTLKIAPTNVRVDPIPPEQFEMMKLSVAVEGIKEPIIINENDEIVSGGIRWKAALDVGLPTVPCVRKKFRDKFEERVTCFMQDHLHHPLTGNDRHNFVLKALEEDKKTFSEIARSLGVTEETVRRWARFGEIPEQLKEKPTLRQTFLIKSGRIRDSLLKLSKTPYFKEHPEEFLKVVEANPPVRAIDEMTKDSKLKVPINVDFRIKISGEARSLVELYIPDQLNRAFINKAKEVQKDPKEILITLITKFVSGEITV